MADYVHQEQKWILVYLILFLFIVMMFCCLDRLSSLLRTKKIEEPNRSTNPWLLRNISALPCGRSVLF